MLDADGSTDPAEIPRSWPSCSPAPTSPRAPGSRPAGERGHHQLRRLGNRVLRGTGQRSFGTGYCDLCYGYNAFWGCLPAMSVDCDGFEVETLINIRIARAGLAIAEVPSYERPRIHGESNLRTFRDGWRVLRTIVAERLRHERARAPVETFKQTDLSPMPENA